MEPSKIFISYGREPEITKFVEWLKSKLEHTGFRVWLDTKDIPAGSPDWRAEIGKALKSSTSLICVITKKYVASEYCKRELYVAHEKRKQIFPLIYDDKWTSAKGGDGVEYIISPINWTFFRKGTDDFGASFQQLVSALGGGHGGVSEGMQLK